MIKYWKLKKVNNLSKFLILNKDSIWIAEINEGELSIEEAIINKKLHGKTKFYRFHELQNIMFDEDKKELILNFISDADDKKRPSVKLNIPIEHYEDLKNHLLAIFKSKSLKELTFIDKNQPLILSIIITLIIALILNFTIGLSVTSLSILVALSILEVVFLRRSFMTPKNGKILKIN